MIEWQSRALVLSARAFSDSDCILTVLTENHGCVAGLVKGGQSRKRQSDLQLGTLGHVNWRARLEAQLGQFTFEGDRAFAAQCLDDRARLNALEAICIMALQTLAEREPAPGLFAAALTWLNHLQHDYWALLYVKLELGLLTSLGFSVDFSTCALGGSADELTHVSPKTGRAVCADGAAPYLDKLLPLPAFLGGAQDLGDQELSAGLNLSGDLLARHVFAPLNKDLPEVRHRLATRLSIPKIKG